MERKGFIGGSDCTLIAQGKWADLWEIKTGRREPDDLSDNIAVQLGVLTENFNLNWFEKMRDTTVYAHQLEKSETIMGVPAKATIDGKVYDGDIIEAKHTNAFNSMDNVTSYYMPQIQLYMHISGAQNCFLSVIFGNNKWESACVSYDKRYFNSMWALVKEFWGYVDRDERPDDLDPSQAPSTNSVPVNEMVIRDATHDNEFASLAIDYIENQPAAKLFEASKKQLKMMVADNEREVFNDKLSIKRSANGSLRFTAKKEKASD